MIRSSTVGESQLYSIGSSVSSSSTISIRLPSYTSTIYLFFIVTSTTYYDANQGGNNVGLLYFAPFFHTKNYRCTNLVSFNVLWYGEIANYLRMANITSLCITLFNDSVSFLYFLSASQNLCFFEIFRLYKNGTLAWNGLINSLPNTLQQLENCRNLFLRVFFSIRKTEKTHLLPSNQWTPSTRYKSCSCRSMLLSRIDLLVSDLP